MTWKENPSVFLWVRIQGCVFPPPHKGHWQVWHFQKSVGSWGPLQLLWRSGRSEAVTCYMLWSAGIHPAPRPAAELALAGLPHLHGCPLWNRVWNQIDHDFWNCCDSQQGEALTEAAMKTSIRKLNPNNKQDPWGHLDALTEQRSPWLQVRAKNRCQKSLYKWSIIKIIGIWKHSMPEDIRKWQI